LPSQQHRHRRRDWPDRHLRNPWVRELRVGDLMTLGAYVALFVNMNMALSLVWGAIVSFVVLALVGILLEVLIFARLESRGPVPPIVASVGVGLIVQNGIRAVATTQQWIFRVP